MSSVLIPWAMNTWCYICDVIEIMGPKCESYLGGWSQSNHLIPWRQKSPAGIRDAAEEKAGQVRLRSERLVVGGLHSPLLAWRRKGTITSECRQSLEVETTDTQQGNSALAAQQHATKFWWQPERAWCISFHRVSSKEHRNTDLLTLGFSLVRPMRQSSDLYLSHQICCNLWTQH